MSLHHFRLPSGRGMVSLSSEAIRQLAAAETADVADKVFNKHAADIPAKFRMESCVLAEQQFKIRQDCEI